MTDLTPVIHAAAALAAAVLTVFVVPWLRSKTSEQDRAELLKWVDVAVAAAQQLYYQLDGAQRKEYALEILREKGFDVSDRGVDAAVEAAVLKLHKGLEAGNGNG